MIETKSLREGEVEVDTALRRDPLLHKLMREERKISAEWGVLYLGVFWKDAPHGTQFHKKSTAKKKKAVCLEASPNTPRRLTFTDSLKESVVDSSPDSIAEQFSRLRLKKNADLESSHA